MYKVLYLPDNKTNKMKKAKNINLTEKCIETLTIQAVKKRMVFKTYVEEILEKLAAKSNGK